MVQTTKQNIPPCSQCVAAKVPCHGKTRGPGCWRCYKRKMGCSAVGGQKRKKGAETDGTGMKRLEGRGRERAESGESDRRTEVMERMTEVMEGLTEMIGELVEEQRGIRLAMEVKMRREEEKEKKREKVEKNKGKRKEKEVQMEE